VLLQLLERFANHDRMRTLTLGDGESQVFISFRNKEWDYLKYVVFPAFDSWRSRESARGKHFSDDNALDEWLRVEGYEYVKNRYDLYQSLVLFLAHLGIPINRVASYQTFTNMYELKFARARRS
jgi:hypothetical protein